MLLAPVIEEIKKILADNNMSIAAISCHGNPVHPDKATAEMYHNDFNNAVLLAEKLGVKFEVIKITDTEVVCKTIIGGTLSNKKSMSFPNKVMEGPYLSEQDKEDLLFGIQNDVDFVAASFVSNAKAMKELRTFLNKNGGQNIDIIAKIENQSGCQLSCRAWSHLYGSPW